jgi:photosystem II stability/assembly factor-like uncharacterized protein
VKTVTALVLALAASPAAVRAQVQVISRMFAATTDGPFITYSWGEHWTRLRPDVRGLAGEVDVFLCLGPAVFAGGSAGVFVSDDFGENYRRIDRWPADAGAVMSFHAARLFALEPTVFAGTSNGLYRSTDGGGEWERVGAREITSAVRDIVWPGPELFIATDAGLYRTVDQGKLFVRLDGAPDAPVLALAISRFFGVEPTLFAGTRGKGLHKSTDGGAKFVAVGGDPLARSTVHALFWWESLLLVGTDEGLFLSDDGGKKFRAVKELAGVPVLAISVPAAESGGGSEVIVGTNEGVLKSSDGAQTFRLVREGLGRPAVKHLATFPMPVQDRERRRD